MVGNKNPDVIKKYVNTNLDKIKEVAPDFTTKKYKYERPHYQETKPNASHQADLMFISSDRHRPKQPKQALVVSDFASKKLDVAFTNGRTAKDSTKALKKIYQKNKILEPPTYRIVVDAGNEFEGEFSKYVKKDLNKVLTKKTAGKSIGHIDKQIAFIKDKFADKQDKFDQQIYETNSKSKTINDFNFTSNMNNIVDELNSKELKKPRSRPRNQSQKNIIGAENTNENLLEVGQIVRRVLHKQINRNTGKSEFKKGDVRWSHEKFKIVNLYLTPGSPPMYELQKVDENNNIVGEPDVSNPVHYRQIKLASYFKK